MSGSSRHFERRVLRLLVALVVLLIVAIAYLVVTWPGDGGVFGWGLG